PRGAGIDRDDGPKELQGLRLFPLERVSAYDGAEAAAVADRAGLVQQLLVVFLLRAPREDHDAPSVERGLHHVPHPIGQRRHGDRVFLVSFPRLLLFDVLGWKLHLEDVGAELGGDVGGVGDDVDAGLARLAYAGPARIAPDHYGEAESLGFLRHRPDLLVHSLGVGGPRVDREPDRAAAKAERVTHAGGYRGDRILFVVEDVVIIQFQNEWDLPREFRRPRLDEPERGGIGVAPRLDGQLEVESRIVSRGVRGEGPCGAVLEPLVHRKNDEPSGARERAVVQETRDVRLGPRVVGAVPGEDLSDPL